VLVRLVLWSLADSKTTIEELRRYLRDESVDAFEDVPGLRFKAWISDEATDRWRCTSGSRARTRSRNCRAGLAS
jgi:hypothetical protein